MPKGPAFVESTASASLLRSCKRILESPMGDVDSPTSKDDGLPCAFPLPQVAKEHFHPGEGLDASALTSQPQAAAMDETKPFFSGHFLWYSWSCSST